MPGLAERLKRDVDLKAHLIARGVAFDGKLARCPFHEDAKGSVSVNLADDAWVWHCFGCGAAGSIIDFEMKMRGVDAAGAITALAEQYGITAPAAHERQAVRGGGGESAAPDTPETSPDAFPKAIAEIYRSARRNLVQGEVPAAVRFLESRGIPLEVALRCGLGATHLTKPKYRKLMRWCEACFGVEAKDLGLGGLFAYAKRGLTVLVYPYWPNFSPPDPGCAADTLPCAKYATFRPTISRAKAVELEVPPHFKPKGHECSDPWCPVGLPEKGGVLWLVEGETDAMTLIALGLTAAAMPGASTRLPKRFLKMLRERDIRVCLVADADSAGEAMLAGRVHELVNAGVSVEAFRLPADVDGNAAWGKDLNDLVRALSSEGGEGSEGGAGAQRWRELLVPVAIDELPAPAETPEPSVSVTSSSSRPYVITSDMQLRGMIGTSWGGLKNANDPPQLYRQGEGLAYLGVDPDDMEKPDRERKPAILPVDATIMNGMLVRALDWLRITEKGAHKPSRPPRDVPRDMVCFRPLPKWLPKLEAVTSTPSYGPDLQLIEPGYCADLRLAYMPSVAIAPRLNPPISEVAAAVEKVFDLLVDFPFQSEADRINHVAVMLLSVLRPAIRGNVPLVAIVATIQRSGKGALCAIIEGLMTGTNASSAQYSTDHEEFRKALLPYISRGQPIIRLDNIDDGGELSSPHLASAITEGYYADRVLGQSEIRGVPVRSMFITTGNKITVSRDLLYRTLWIRLAPDDDEPDKRDFSVDEIEDHVREHRAEYLAALATMVEHWKATGAKQWKGRRWNSFNPFVRTVGGVLEACGIEGFLGNADEQRAAGNPEEREWKRVLGRWSEATSEAQPANWLLENVFAPCEPLAHISIRGKTSSDPRARSLSRLLGKEAGRPRSLPSGQVVRIERSRDGHRNVDLFILETRPHRGREHTRGPHNYPATILARIPHLAGSGEHSEQSEYISHLPLKTDHSRCQYHIEQMAPEHSIRIETDPESGSLSSLCSPDLAQQGLTSRAKPADDAEGFGHPRTPPLSLQPCRGRSTAEGSDADHASTTPALPFHLPPDWRDWPEDIRVEFEERAAIREYDGGQGRAEAESAAEVEVRTKYERADEQRESEVA